MGHFRHYDRRSILAVAEQAGLVPETSLAQNSALNTIHLYLYSILRVLALAASGLSGHPVTVYSLTLPGQSVPVYEQLGRVLFARLTDKVTSNDDGERQTFFAFRNRSRDDGARIVRRAEGETHPLSIY
jgi:hypothetical protein